MCKIVSVDCLRRTVTPCASRLSSEDSQRKESIMYLVCGEALFDVFAAPAGSRSNRLNLEAVAGGSSFNVAVGLARLGTPSALFPGIYRDYLGQRLMQVPT